MICDEVRKCLPKCALFCLKYLTSNQRAARVRVQNRVCSIVKVSLLQRKARSFLS